MEEVDAVKSSFLDIPHSIDNPPWQGGMRPNGPKLFSPAEADRPTWVLRLATGQASSIRVSARRVSISELSDGTWPGP